MGTDRYAGWHHGCEVDGPLRSCVNCLAKVNEGYYRVVDQRTEVCCDYCADLVLTERTLTELLLLESGMTALDELLTIVGDGGEFTRMEIQSIKQAKGILDAWLKTGGKREG